MRNTTGTYTSSCALSMSIDLSSVETNVKSRRTQSHSLALSKKVDAVYQMPSPETPSQLQQFLRMGTYLSPFIPSLSTHTAPLQESPSGTLPIRKPLTGQGICLQGYNSPLL